MRGEDLMASVTAAIIDSIEAGAGDWKMPWSHPGFEMLATNAVTHRTYRGGNVMQLWGTCAERMYDRNLWATYQQWATVDAQVRRGERGTPIIFWKTIERGTDVDNEQLVKRGVYMKVSHVFNIAQVDNAPLAPAPSPLTSLEIDQWFANIGATIVHDAPCYMRDLDQIGMPPVRFFAELSDFYATMAHEHAHWTGHRSRLDRDLGVRFGDEAYAMEELTAELSAAFTCSLLGVATTPRPDHAQYLAHWLKVLRADPSALYHIASKAQAATDFLAGFNPALSPELEGEKDAA